MAERDLVKINSRFLKNTKNLSDRVYDWIITKYTTNNHEFKASDRFVWTGTVYMIPTWIGYLLFISLFMLLASFSIEKYGEARTIIFFMILIIWRLQSMLTELKK